MFSAHNHLFNANFPTPTVCKQPKVDVAWRPRIEPNIVKGVALFRLRQPLPQALPRQRHRSSFCAQEGESRGLSTSSTREARLLTPHLAQTELSGGFKAIEVPHAAVPCALAAAQHRRSLGVIDHGAFHGWNAPYRAERIVELSGLSRRTWPRADPFVPSF